MGYKSNDDSAFIESGDILQEDDQGNWVSYEEEIRVKADVVSVLESSTADLLITDKVVSINDVLIIDGQSLTVSEVNSSLNLEATINSTAAQLKELNTNEINRVFVSPTGRKAFTHTDTQVIQYDLPIEDDLENMTFEKSIDVDGDGFYMGHDGTYFFKYSRGASTVTKYYLTEAWNIDSVDSNTELASGLSNIGSIEFNSTGEWYYATYQDGDISCFSLSTAYDLDSKTLISTINAPASNGHIILADDYTMFVTTSLTGSGDIYQVDTTTAGDFSNYTIEPSNTFTGLSALFIKDTFVFLNDSHMFYKYNYVNFSKVNISDLSLSKQPVNVSHFLDVSNLEVVITLDDVEQDPKTPLTDNTEYDAGDYIVHYAVSSCLARKYKIRVNIPTGIEVMDCNVKFTKQEGIVTETPVDFTNGNVLVSSDIAEEDEYGCYVDCSDEYIVVGAKDAGTSGKVYVTNLLGENEIIIEPSDGQSDQLFGFSVANTNTHIAVGAIYDDTHGTGSGAAYVYNIDGTGEVKILASDGETADAFGSRVAISDTKILVASKYEDEKGDNAGAAYLYDLDGTNELKIMAGNAYDNDQFGTSIAMSNDKIAVGAVNVWDDETEAGNVYVYDYSGTELFRIKASDTVEDLHFGYSVAISDTHIAVGTIDSDNKGAVYIYDIDGTNEIKIVSSDGAAGDNFGYALDINSEYIAIGAQNDDGTGSVYMYELSGVNENKFTDPSGNSSDSYGSTVGLSEKKLVIGSPKDDEHGTNAGKVYTFG